MPDQEAAVDHFAATGHLNRRSGGQEIRRQPTFLKSEERESVVAPAVTRRPRNSQTALTILISQGNERFNRAKMNQKRYEAKTRNPKERKTLVVS
jgi:hypothetical protein